MIEIKKLREYKELEAKLIEMIEKVKAISGKSCKGWQDQKK